MKKFLSLALALTTALALAAPALAAEGPDDPTLTWLDAAADDPEDYQSITGFEITYKLLKGGHMGSEEEPFPVNGLMIAKGACNAEDFTWDNNASLPKFLGPAEDLIAHVTGDGSFVGTMFFSNGVDAGALAEGESATLRYEGTEALFDDENTCVTAYELFETEVEIENVTWLKGEIVGGGEKLTWDSVETDEYMDVPTVENGSEANYVNITVPKGDGPYPVILWIHGGAWSALDRNSCFISRTMDYLLSRGFAVVSAEYTLSDVKDGVVITSGYPQMIYDLKAAVRFLRANAAQYRLDPDYIVAMGESAGAHLGMLLGTTNGRAEYEDLSMGNGEFSSDVQLMVSYFGPTDCIGDEIMGRYIVGEDYTMEQTMAVSPYYQITKDAPPLYLTHGANDQSVRIMHSEKMSERAKQLLGEENVTTVFYEDAPHANVKVYDSDAAILSVTEFIEGHLTKFREEQAAAPSENAPAESTPAQSAPPSTPVENSEQTAGVSPAVIAVIATAFIAAAIAAVIVLCKKKKN